ncbi:MAG: hypothetical protein HKN04_07355 [Rhodothermaceae bacterium]|nr:hypothetical protein [Rhodothermaceae bacterium]
MLAQLEEQLRDAGEDWIGVPYRYGGTTRRGIDCSAFVQTFMRDHTGLDLTRTTATQVQEGEAIDKDELQPGDLVFFRRRGTRHVGVYLDDGEFIHASSSRGVTVSNLEEGYYQRHYWTARRVLDAPAVLMATNPRSRRAHDEEAESIGADESAPDGATRSAW